MANDVYPGYILSTRPTVSASVVPIDWARYHLLTALIKSMGWTRGVEIGVSFGSTFRHLLEHNPDLHLFGVDTWALNPGAPEPDDWDHALHARAYASAQAIAKEYSGRATLIRARSGDGLAGVEPGSLDFVWIDGDHGTDACAKDIVVWMDALKPTGWLLGHDINWPTVKAAVDPLLPGYLIAPDNVWFRPLHPRTGWWAEKFGSGWPEAPAAPILEPDYKNTLEPVAEPTPVSRRNQFRRRR